MCLLSQTSDLATEKLINFVTLSFVDTFRAAIYADSRKLLAATPIFTGLVERATEWLFFTRTKSARKQTYRKSTMTFEGGLLKTLAVR